MATCFGHPDGGTLNNLKHGIHERNFLLGDVRKHRHRLGIDIYAFFWLLHMLGACNFGTRFFPVVIGGHQRISPRNMFLFQFQVSCMFHPFPDEWLSNVWNGCYACTYKNLETGHSMTWFAVPQMQHGSAWFRIYIAPKGCIILAMIVTYSNRQQHFSSTSPKKILCEFHIMKLKKNPGKC